MRGSSIRTRLTIETSRSAPPRVRVAGPGDPGYAKPCRVLGIVIYRQGVSTRVGSIIRYRRAEFRGRLTPDRLYRMPRYRRTDRINELLREEIEELRAAVVALEGSSTGTTAKGRRYAMKGGDDARD